MASAKSANKLAFVSLRIPRSKLTDTVHFYTNALQFSELEAQGHADSGAGPLARCVSRRRYGLTRASQGFPLNSAGVEFVTPAGEDTADFSPYRPERSDIYWKIGLSLHDLDASIPSLIKNVPGFSMDAGSQFLDIGYLAHLRDPAGFAVELLQTTFEGSVQARRDLIEKSAGEGASSPLAQEMDVVVGQITTRITDAEASLKFYREVLGMKLLSIQPVNMYGFVLYFLAYTDEDPPNPEDLYAVENREWCWQRPYTTLELQHVLNRSSGLRNAAAEESGMEAIVVQIGEDALWRRLHEGAALQEDSEKRTYVTDPDGLKVVVEKL